MQKDRSRLWDALHATHANAHGMLNATRVQMIPNSALHKRSHPEQLSELRLLLL
jgi:hypothetical protein